MAAILADMSQDPDKGHRALRRGRISVPNQIYSLTATTLERRPFFLDFATACAAARCFEDPALLRDGRMLAWVLMPDHAHWLLQLGEQDDLHRVLVRLKSASARAANRALGRQGSLWARSFHDHALRRDEDIAALARYIVRNPVRAGLVSRVGLYPFWNAVWIDMA